MRAKEFIKEDHMFNGDTSPRILSFDKMSNYDYYRFGMDMAGGEDMDRDTDLCSHYIAYTDADVDKIKAAAKKNGMNVKSESGPTEEPTDTDHTSPVAKRKKNKYGI